MTCARTGGKGRKDRESKQLYLQRNQQGQRVKDVGRQLCQADAEQASGKSKNEWKHWKSFKIRLCVCTWSNGFTKKEERRKKGGQAGGLALQKESELLTKQSMKTRSRRFQAAAPPDRCLPKTCGSMTSRNGHSSRERPKRVG